MGASISMKENARLGAIEALARITNEEAEEIILKIAQTEEEEDVKKAAWRALRRSKRYRDKRAEAKK